MTISSEVDERTLRELYLVPFEAAVAPLDEGGADVRSVMSSYNRINGTYACDNGPLLRDVLRDELGFDGVVFSDWFGTHSAAASLEAGLDLEMPGPPIERGEHAARRGARRRGGRAPRRRVGAPPAGAVRLEPGRASATPPSAPTTRAETRALIRRDRRRRHGAAEERRRRAPARPRTRGIALIGPNAERGQIQGGGSAAGAPEPSVAPARRAARPRPRRGLRAGLLDRQAAAGAARHVHDPLRERWQRRRTAARRACGMLWMDAPAPGIDRRRFTATITGSFTPGRVRRLDVRRHRGRADPRRGRTARPSPTCPTGSPAGRSSATPTSRSASRCRCEAGVPCAVEVFHGEPDTVHLRAFSVGAAGPADAAGDRPGRRRGGRRRGRRRRGRDEQRLGDRGRGPHDDGPARRAGRADPPGRRGQPTHGRGDQRRLAGGDAVARRRRRGAAGLVPRRGAR